MGEGLTSGEGSSVKWSDPGCFLKSHGKFFFSFHVPIFYIFLTSKITDDTLKVSWVAPFYTIMFAIYK